MLRIGYILFAAISIIILSTIIWDNTPYFWGLHHIHFLNVPGIISTLLLLVSGFLLSLSLTSSDRFVSALADFTQKIHDNKVIAIVSALIAGVILYLIPHPTHFGGDGYTWLSNFALSDTYVSKSTELLSIQFVRGLQSLSGTYTETSARLSFVFLSIVSGIIYLAFSIKTVHLLFTKPVVKLLGAVCLIFSGTIVMFTGYVEFYPLYIAFAIVAVYFILKSIESKTYLLIMILSCVFVLFIHAQAVYLIPAALYALIISLFPKIEPVISQHKRQYLIGLAVLIIIGTTVAYVTPSFVKNLVPLFYAIPESPHYSVFSVQHLFDIVNLIFLILPGFPILVAGLIGPKKEPADRDHFHQRVLFLMTIFGCLFILFVEPKLGMARDWDLMTFPVLLMALYLLKHWDKRKEYSSKLAVLVISLSVVVSCSYLLVNSSAAASEHRYTKILKAYDGLKYRNGWLILRQYYENNQMRSKEIALVEKIKELFPEYLHMEQAYKYIERGLIAEGGKISTSLIERYPNTIDFIQLHGMALTNINSYDSAAYYFEKGLFLQPTYPGVLREYGNMLNKQGRLHKALPMLIEAYKLVPDNPDNALSLSAAYRQIGNHSGMTDIAQRLLKKNQQEPAGLLIMLFLYADQKNESLAKKYYTAYLQHGTNRPEYELVKNQFANLAQ